MIKDTDECTTSVVQQIVTNICKTTAYNRVTQCREALKKQKHHILQVKEFKKYYGIQ